MGFSDRYVHALNTSNLKDDERHHQAEPLAAAGLASAATGDLGALLHRAKYAGTVAESMAHAVAARARAEKDLAEAVRVKNPVREAECRQALEGDAAALEAGVAQMSQLLRVWIAEVTRRGRARAGCRKTLRGTLRQHVSCTPKWPSTRLRIGSMRPANRAADLD